VSESTQTHPEIAALIQQVTHCLVLTDALYQAVSQVEHGVGIFFVVLTPRSELPAQITQNVVMLDNVQDPGNMGSLLRSAAAAGIEWVICSPGTVSAWSPKVMRAGMGAHFLLQIVENVDLLQVLAQTTIPILATSSYATQTVYQCNLKQPVVWLFGHEGQGLSDELMDFATEQVTIPHQGAIESLNVAACAAICFFEQVRQNLD
jgi:TrmH family RNA methyltransferase